jgi:hypothetical protein
MFLFCLWGIFKNRHLSNATGRIRDEFLINQGGRAIRKLLMCVDVESRITFGIENGRMITGQYYTVKITYGSDVKGFDAVRVGRGMPRAPVPFSAVVVRHTAGEASRSVRCPRLGCQSAGRGVANKQVSQQAGLYLQYVQKRRCWYLVAPEPFGDGVRDLGDCSGRGSKKSAARTYDFSGRTWTPLILPVRGGGGCEEESGMARVPSQWEGTGQDKGRKRDGRGFLTMGRNGPGQGEKRDGRGSPTMGRNGPGQGGNGMAGAPPQWEGTGRDKGREAESESEVVSGAGLESE